jgi:hypothetical protein
MPASTTSRAARRQVVHVQGSQSNCNTRLSCCNGPKLHRPRGPLFDCPPSCSRPIGSPNRGSSGSLAISPNRADHLATSRGELGAPHRQPAAGRTTGRTPDPPRRRAARVALPAGAPGPAPPDAGVALPPAKDCIAPVGHSEIGVLSTYQCTRITDDPNNNRRPRRHSGRLCRVAGPARLQRRAGGPLCSGNPRRTPNPAPHAAPPTGLTRRAHQC